MNDPTITINYGTMSVIDSAGSNEGRRTKDITVSETGLSSPGTIYFSSGYLLFWSRICPLVTSQSQYEI